MFIPPKNITSMSTFPLLSRCIKWLNLWSSLLSALNTSYSYTVLNDQMSISTTLNTHKCLRLHIHLTYDPRTTYIQLPRNPSEQTKERVLHSSTSPPPQSLDFLVCRNHESGHQTDVYSISASMEAMDSQERIQGSGGINALERTGKECMTHLRTRCINKLDIIQSNHHRQNTSNCG